MHNGSSFNISYAPCNFARGERKQASPLG